MWTSSVFLGEIPGRSRLELLGRRRGESRVFREADDGLSPKSTLFTTGYIQLGPAGTGPVAAVVEPLPEILAEAVPSATGREGRGHGVLAGAASENGPADPQDQTGLLWPGEVR